MCGLPKAGGSGCCGGGHRHAAGHQHGGGLQDKLHILAHIRHTGHVLAVQLLQGVAQLLAKCKEICSWFLSVKSLVMHSLGLTFDNPQV